MSLPIFPISMIIQCLSLIKASFYPVLSTIALVVFIIYTAIHFLNRYALRKKPDAFRPIHKQASQISEFEKVVRAQLGNVAAIVEEHTIKTKDGYLLKCHRVKLRDNLMEDADKKFANKPVLLHHGFFNSSVTMFFSCGEHLVASGFDCWFLNARGNRFSMYHENSEISYENFYDFTLDDYVTDVKTHYEYIMEKTDFSKIFYVGYSIGGMTYAMSHSDPENKDFYKNHTEKSILIAPLLCPTSMKPEHQFKHTKESMQFFLKKTQEMGTHHWCTFVNFEDLSFCNLDQLMKDKYPVWDLSQCDISKPNSEVDDMFSKIVLPDLPILIFPFLTLLGFKIKFLGGEGSSVKSYVHALHQLTLGEIAKYDHGKKENLVRYGSEIPPSFDFSNISTETHIITGSLDESCNTAGANQFAKTLEQGLCTVYEIPKYKHISFLAQKDPHIVNEVLDLILKK